MGEPPTEIDAAWDSVVRLEEEAFACGRSDAERDAREEGSSRRAGQQAGFLRGYALGLEIGFIEAAMTQGADGELPASRHSKRVASLLKLTKELPMENVATVDFDATLREMRALYKLCGSPAGPFRPASSVEPSLGW